MNNKDKTDTLSYRKIRFLGILCACLFVASACQKLATLLQEEVPITGITLNKTTTTIAVGGTEQLVATVTPQEATHRTVSWSSSHSTIATVSSSGLVTGISEGSANILVTTDEGGFQASCSVSVTPSGSSVAAPTFSIAGGTYSSSQDVILSCATSGATIKYTTDGSDPKTSPTAVTGNTVFVSMPMTIKALAFKAGMQDSTVATSGPFTITSGIVFVSLLTGNDGNQGTKARPKKTIQAGIDLAGSLFPTGEVRLAQGIFYISAQVNLKEGISLYGGYLNDFSSRSVSNAISSIVDTRTTGDCIAIAATNITSATVLDGFVIQGASTSSGSSVCINLSTSSPVIRNNTIVRNTASVNSFGIGMSASSPLIYNNVIYGGTAGNWNTAIFMNNGSSPKIYNNTLLCSTGSVVRWAITLRADGANCYPYVKNNLLVDLDSNGGGSPGLYHMNSGSGHYPYSYTTNLFYMAPNATGDGAYVYYSSGNSANINVSNYVSQVAYTYSAGSQLLTYNDPAWRNLVNQDPLFVNPAANDYHLQASSPARAAGTDLSAEIPAFDRDGNPRSVPWSIGAYERE
ncbi:MAG: Ig-like domain-containing protein [Spirochaetes bacterium]|nr:Ig-like domain-containing protein [Spirochaetota bacterium]